MSQLFEPFVAGDLTLKNRLVMSPMCQYSAQDGQVTDWHLLHYPARAVGGIGTVMLEATAVEARGRISPQDLGLWSEDQVAPLAELVQHIRNHGSVVAIQLAHAGRKAGTARPWEGGQPLGLWQPVGSSALPFAAGWPVPHSLDEGELKQLAQAWAAAADRAARAGIQVIELHMAHGYLLHSFLSPLANQRTDRYGGSFENRVRFPLEVVSRVREVWSGPLWVRLSATDWAEGGWTLDDSVHLARQLGQHGVSLVDCSSGGIQPGIRIPVEPGYQVPLAARIRQETGIPTGAVGMITGAAQAEAILQQGQADLIFVGRPLLANPYWPLQAALELGDEGVWPVQYQRATGR